ncbi:MAG: hypothetical protein A2622_14185 [Bdellovibrionales bacterium RIFCSPHIGHO2_01_FULL_40_29]|nr:MAG: hypothetical protein A2622_14185 [Bdellovibrionales bacterium RIFCSPHIGHO2_01_FULL_40_29]OFZ33670.1 MAG: hypothetical protein A3D17_11795 [Bdellovibrionales bacterium RIFCSPHIGHO2_02_FULL_40_15]
MPYSFCIKPSIDEITQLRKESFVNFYCEKVRPQGLEWNSTDEQSIHIGIRHQDQLISCLRITALNDLSELRDRIKIPLTLNQPPPYILLARAATSPLFLNKGLHSLLRIRALEISLQQNYTQIFGSLEKRSTRLNQLLDIGYEIIGEASHWPNSFLENQGSVVAIQLSSKNKIEKALGKLYTIYQIKPMIHTIETFKFYEPTHL